MAAEETRCDGAAEVCSRCCGKISSSDTIHGFSDTSTATCCNYSWLGRQVAQGLRSNAVSDLKSLLIRAADQLLSRNGYEFDSFSIDLSELDEDSPGASKNHAQPPPGRFQLVEHVQHDELEAAEMVIRCLYKTGDLPQPAHGNPTLLLKMHRLADKYQFPARCMESIALALSALHSDQLTAEVVAEIYSLPPATFPSEPLQRLLGLCGQAVTQIFNGASPLTSDALHSAVVHIFGDVPAVVTSEERRVQFCSLPYEAVLAWVKVRGGVVRDDSIICPFQTMK